MYDRPVTSSRVGRPRDERLDGAILEATVAILNEVGYASMTLEAVAARAGTTKPALRRRWRGRQHLVVDALVTTVGSVPTPDTGCTRCDLVAGIQTLTEAFTNKIGRRVLPALVADLADDQELADLFLRKYFLARRASTAAALRRGIERGDLDPDLDVDLMLDMLASTTYYRVLFGHLPITENLAEQVVDVVLNGVATAHGRGH
jgi:AcrR family transcriptional regulator